MSVVFNDNTMSVKKEMQSKVESFLTEAGGEVQAQTVRNSRTDTGQTKDSYEYKVDKGSDKATLYVGSNYENAIWEEYGTGEYAVNGDGRKGEWVYCKDGKFYKTHGKTANKPLSRAFESCKSMIQNAFNNLFS